jgi:hypothetical protein
MGCGCGETINDFAIVITICQACYNYELKAFNTANNGKAEFEQCRLATNTTIKQMAANNCCPLNKWKKI